MMPRSIEIIGLYRVIWNKGFNAGLFFNGGLSNYLFIGFLQKFHILEIAPRNIVLSRK